MVHSGPDVYVQHIEALIKVMTGVFVIDQQQLESHTSARLVVVRQHEVLSLPKGWSWRTQNSNRNFFRCFHAEKKSGFTCRNLVFFSDCNCFPFIYLLYFRTNYWGQRCLNLIRLDRSGWDWKRGPAPVTVLPPCTAQMSGWTSVDASLSVLKGNSTSFTH